MATCKYTIETDDGDLVDLFVEANMTLVKDIYATGDSPNEYEITVTDITASDNQHYDFNDLHGVYQDKISRLLCDDESGY
jgi:hypothetical protein